MAVTSVILDIKANTDRALNDFKRFSAQLDNKFLVSGLKLDVVRSALSQINREFQRSIGEQGLQAGQSLRAAQNQAALLTQTFKGFSTTASLDMAEQFSTAFNEIAVKAGGTAQDIQKALAATPFISTNLSEDMRKALGEGVVNFQRDFRRAGLTEDFGGIARQFLMGQLTAREMINSGEAGQSFLGTQLMKSSGGNIDLLTNAQQRSEALYNAMQDPEFRRQLEGMAKRAYGFRGIIEDLNSRLFNPEKGIFGSLRQVTMSVRDKTTIFDETNKLVESVFGRQGFFVNFFVQIGKIFGIEDPLKIVISGVRWITRQFDTLNKFVQSPEIQGIVKLLQETFNRVKEFVNKVYTSITTGFEDPDSTVNRIKTGVGNFFKSVENYVKTELGKPDSILSSVKSIAESVGGLFKSILDTVKAGEWDPTEIVSSIKKIGENVRTFIERVGKSVREADVEDQGRFFLEIFKTVVGEVAETLGTAIKEAILTVFSSKGLAALAGVLEVLYEATSKFFTGLFGGNQAAGGIVGGLATGGIVLAFGKRIATSLGLLATNIARAVPGAGLVTGPIRRALGGLGQRVAMELRRFPLLGRLLPNGGGTGGAAVSQLGFEREMLMHVRRIANCVCNPLGPGGSGIGGTDGGRRRARDPITGRTYPRHTPDIEDFDDAIDATGGGGAPGTPPARRGFRSRLGGGLRRLGRGARGFGKGALILGGAALLGGALLGGGDAQASEIDPITGQPTAPPSPPKVGAGEAFGRVGMGALEGASTGAMIGSFIPGVGTALGAGIGGAIGAATQLFDSGIRDAIGDFLSEMTGNLVRGAGDLVEGLKRNVLKAFDSLKTFVSGIDWKAVLIQTLVPGGQFTIDGLQSLGRFASKLGVFDAIKTGIDKLLNPIDTIKGLVDGIRENLPGWLGGKREVGGPVIKGVSYLVGERGPEIFTPGQTGTVSSNRELMALTAQRGSASNVSANFNVSINVNGGMTVADVETLRAPILSIIEQAWAEATQGTVTRGAIV